MATKDTLKSLVLTMEHARFTESMHQQVCRARRAGNPCVSCDQYEAAWLATDRRLNDFLDAAAVLEQTARDDDDRYGLVDAF